MRFIRHLEPFVNVVPTGRAVLNSSLVLGNIIERIYLVLGGTTFTKAMISALRVKLNGKVTFGDISGTNLDLLQTYQLGNTAAGYLTLDFIEPDSKSMQGEILGALDTNAAGVNTFTVECDVAGATAPTLDSWAQLRDVASVTAANGFNPALRPLLRALISTSLTSTAAAEQQYQINYGSGGNSLIKRLVIFSTILTSVRIKRNSLDVFEVVAGALASWMQSDYGKHPQSNMYVVDWLMDGNQSDTQPTRNADGTLANYQWLLTASGAGTFQVYADVYSILGGI
ncbi:MAG: major capsid protein P2 [Acetobacteraceae bacterium]